MVYSGTEPQHRFYRIKFLLLFSLFFSILHSNSPIFAYNITPVDITQKNYLSEIRQLSPNAYIHSRKGFVLIDSGIFVLPVRDMVIPIGNASFIFERTYNSNVVSEGVFGKGWKFNYGLRIEEMVPDILLTEPGGGALLFKKQTNNVYVFDNSGYRTVIKNSDGSFVYYREDVAHYFDRTGRLVRVETGNMNYYLTYKKDKLISVGNMDSPFLQFKYNPKGMVEEMEDMSGQRCIFQYDHNSNLIRESNFNGQTTDYTYNKLNNLVSIQNSNSAKINMLYDKIGRVLQQSGPYDNTTRYQYLTENKVKKTIITNTLNEKMVYIFKQNGRDVKITDFSGGRILKK